MHFIYRAADIHCLLAVGVPIHKTAGVPAAGMLVVGMPVAGVPSAGVPAMAIGCQLRQLACWLQVCLLWLLDSIAGSFIGETWRMISAALRLVTGRDGRQAC